MQVALCTIMGESFSKEEVERRNEEAKEEEEERQRLKAAFIEQLVTCNAESDTLAVTLEAFKQGFINKKDLKALTSINPKVSIVDRRRTLLKCACASLEEKLSFFANHKSEILPLVAQAFREGLIEMDVFDHFSSLHSEVPYSMRYKYLLQCVRTSLIRKLENFKARALSIVPYELTDKFDPFKLAKDAVRDDLIDKCVLEYLISLYPKVPFKLRPISNMKEMFYKLSAQKNGLLKHLGDEVFHLSSTVSATDVQLASKDVQLSPEDLPKLNEVLVSYAYNWKNIGSALKFQPQDLKTIEASPLLMPDAPKSYLARLLKDWLLRRLKHTLPPSMDCLKRALSSLTVGLGYLADEIEQKICTTSTFQRKMHMPYCLINVEPSFPKHASVYVKEGLSTLFEIQVPPGTERTYQWLKDGKDLYHDSSTKPILCLHKADIDWDGCKLSCQIQPGTSAAVPIITLNVSCILDQFRSNLASIYLAQPEVPEDIWSPGGDLKYINLALVKQQEVDYNSESARLTIRGDMDDVLHDKKIITYNDKDFYRNLSSGKLILIEGRPGSGKTTFVHKLTHDWAIKSGGAIRLLLLVSLRVLNIFRNPDLSDILELFDPLPVSRDIIEKRSGKGVCFIFDDFDEFSPQNGQSSIVHKIINKTYLNNSIVIVASRPAAIAKLRHKANTVIEVVGFLNQQILEYFDHYPFSTTTKSAELKLYLELHPNILHMCYLPIHATMVAFLFQAMREVPKTETEMYTYFTRFTLIRNLAKSREFEPVAIDLSSLTGEEGLCFKKICLLAFEKTLSSKQVLDQSEVASHFQVKRSIDSSLGLITIDRTAGLYSYKNIYTFMHLTFQEYLAAYHVTTLSDEMQMKVIEEYGDKYHMLGVWKFFFGLVGIEQFHDRFESILCETEGSTLFHMMRNLAKTEEFDVLSYLPTVLSQLSDWTEVNLSGYKLKLVSVKFLSEGLRLHCNCCNLDLSNCHMCTDGAEVLAEGLQHCSNLQTLNLSCNRIGACGIKALAKKLCESVKTLNISDNNIDIEGAVALAERMQHLKCLQNLNLNSNPICDEGAMALAQNVHHCRSLKVLNLQSCNISDSGALSLVESLQHCNSQCNLCLDINDEHLQYLKAYRQVLGKKESIEMWFIKVILLGAPGLGKSTVRRRLTGEIKDISSSGEGEQPSTGVIDSGHTIVIREIKKLFSTTALVTPSEWRATKDVTDEVSMILQLLLDYFQNKYLVSNKEKKIHLSSDTKQDTVKKASPRVVQSTSSVPVSGDSDPTSTLASPVVESSIPLSFDADIKSQIGSVKQFETNSEWYGELKQAVATNSWKMVKELLMDLMFLRVEDTGGQPEFMDMLPALTIGPALYLLFCNLLDDLQSQYSVTYRSPSGEHTTPVQSTYSVEEVLFSALASISCMKSSSGLAKLPVSSALRELLDSSKKSLAYIIGTHRDKVSEEEFTLFDIKMQCSIEATDFFQKQLVWPLSKGGGMVFPVDNMKGGEEEIQRMRVHLEEGIKKHFVRLSIPASWLMLSLNLRLRKERAVSFESVLQLAKKELNIDEEEVKLALWFLHHFAGVLMYFPDVPMLADTVICDTQLVYDSTTSLIVNTYRDGSVHLAAAKKFRETGQFLLDDIVQATKEISGGYICIKKLLKLLEHLNIIAPVGSSSSQSSDQKLSSEYFMPCVLHSASKEELGDWMKDHSSPLVSTLFVRYECGYMPIGVFPALIAHLVGNKDNNGIKQFLGGTKKNRVQFRFGRFYDTVTLISQPKYYAVHVEQRLLTNPLQDVCCGIRNLIESTLKTVTSRMNYSFSAGHQLAFECRDCPIGPNTKHLCVVDRLSKVLRCLENEDHCLDLDNKQKVWFEKVQLREHGIINVSQELAFMNHLRECYTLTEEDCCQKVSDFHLSKISTSHCSKWRLLPCHLGMEKIVADDIGRCHAGEEEKRFEFFTKWREMRGSEATYRSLISALLAIDCREDAESVCKLLQSSRPQPSQPSQTSKEGFSIPAYN